MTIKYPRSNDDSLEWREYLLTLGIIIAWLVIGLVIASLLID